MDGEIRSLSEVPVGEVPPSALKGPSLKAYAICQIENGFSENYLLTSNHFVKKKKWEDDIFYTHTNQP